MGVPGKATVTRAGYRAYINSPAWRAVRERYWASKMPKVCYVCGCPRRPGMHLHHRTYKNLGNERLMDLVPVCPPSATISSTRSTGVIPDGKEKAYGSAPSGLDPATKTATGDVTPAG